MPTIHDRIRARLLARVIDAPLGDKRESLAALRFSEWSPRFERRMREGLLMGRFRYGRMQRTDRLNYDRTGSAQKRLAEYRKTGNLEMLVDAANLCMLEFEHGTHPLRHWGPVDDGEHVQLLGESHG